MKTDGALDWPDEILEQLDVVICSVHQRFKLDLEKQTARIRRALEHPLCGIWGHPTGRSGRSTRRRSFSGTAAC